MDCNELNKYLYPFLDDELDMSQNLEVLAHLNVCR